MSEFTVTGRLVQGDPHRAGPPSKDPVTKQPKIDPATGQPRPGQFFCAVAVPKSDPNWPAVKAQLDADARAAWPQFFGTPTPGLQIGPELPAGCTNPKFANKIVDGDGFDEQGQPYSAKEGFAGHWVVKMASQFAPKVWEWRNGWEETIHTGRTVKCGDYVSISGTCVSNQSQQSPGMYMNLGAVAFEREGPAIVSAGGVDPNAAFGARGGAPVNPPASVPAANPPVPAATTPALPTAAPGNPAPPPYGGYMAPPANPPAPPAAAAPVMTAKAAGATYESFIAQGWTDETMRAHGYLV